MALFTRTTPTVTARKTKMEGEVTYIKLDCIEPNPEQPRVDFNEAALEELAASIREHGILQPIAVLLREDLADHYYIVMGERRRRAATMAGLVRIPAIIRTVDNAQEMLELALIENVQRENLNPLEAARAYQKLSVTFGLTHEGISQRTGKSRTSITKALQLLETPKIVQEAVGNDKLPLTSALQMRDLTAHEARPILAQATNNGLSREAVGSLVKATKAKRAGSAGAKSISTASNATVSEPDPDATLEAALPVEPSEFEGDSVDEVAGVDNERNQSLRALLTRFQALDADIERFEQLTGVYTHSASVRRAVGPMVAALKSNLGEV